MKIKDLDLNLLVVFETIYETRNISRAADLLDLSQPAISNSLKRLRTQTGDQLFTRSPKGVEPTTRADEMIGPIRGALTLIKQSSLNTKFDAKTQEKRFRLMLADPLEPLFLPPMLNAMSGTNLSVEVQPLNVGNIEDALTGGTVDLVAFLLPPEIPGLCIEELFPVDSVLIARNDHPRLSGKATDDQILAEEHVALNLMRNKLANAEKVTVSRRQPYTKLCTCHTLATAIRTVAVTDCVAFIPRVYANYSAPIFDLQILETSRQISDQQFYLVWHERNSDDPAHQWLRGLIREKAAQIRKGVFGLD